MKPMKMFVLSIVCTLSFAIGETKKITHTDSVNSAGTAVSTDTTDSTSTNYLGTRKDEHDSKIVRDPKGLGNKVTETTHQNTTISSKGDVKAETNTVDAAGTERETVDSKETAKHWLDKGSTTSITHKDAVDPRGSGNKSTSETEEKIVRNSDGTIAKHSVTKKVDGSTVTEETSEVN